MLIERRGEKTPYPHEVNIPTLKEKVSFDFKLEIVYLL
jgi:hypothetical protein